MNRYQEEYDSYGTVKKAPELNDFQFVVTFTIGLFIALSILVCLSCGPMKVYKKIDRLSK